MNPRTLLLAVSVLGVASPAMSANLFVPSVAFPTIQSAIDGARDGDNILLLDGRYEETLHIVDKSLSFRGNGSHPAHTSIVSPSGRHEIASSNLRFSLIGFHSEQAFDPRTPLVPGEDGLLIHYSNVEFNQCEFSRLVSWYTTNSIGDAGAIEMWQSNVSLLRCTFEGNGAISNKPYWASVARGGAIYAASSTLDIDDCLFEFNFAKSNQGAYSPWECGAEGGAIYMSGCDFTSNGTSYEYNRATGVDGGSTPTMLHGGAIYANSPSSMRLERSYFTENKASFGDAKNDEQRYLGGAMFISHGRSNAEYLKHCRFTENHAADGGGAVYSMGGGRTKSNNCEYNCNTSTQNEGDWFNSGGNVFNECPEPPAPGDFNGDGNVDIKDLMDLYYNWGKVTPGSKYDLNSDGIVDSKDVVNFIVTKYGK